MRRIVVTLGLIGMLTAVGGLGYTRERPELASDDSAADAEDAEAEGGDGNEAADTDAEPEDDGEAKDAKQTDPVELTVVAASWEVLAPGVVANGGLDPAEDSQFSSEGLDVHFAPVTDEADIEAKLGLGGASKGGADIALMPLPAFVASYERLRALSPQVFFVVAWSDGRDALSGDATLLSAPPNKGEVVLSGRRGSAESLLALFALDAAGVSPARVDVVAPGLATKKRALESLRRRKSRQIDAREVLLSTADANRLVPIVAIAPQSVLTSKRAAVIDLSRIWLEGTRKLAADPAGAARLLSKQDGAPKAVDLIDALGWVDFATLPESASALGLSGRRAANLDVLFARTWGLWRESGLLATPPPERLPSSAVVIAELVDAEGVGSTTRPTPAKPPADAEPVLVHRVRGRKLSPDAELELVAEVGFLADVFARSKIRIWVPRDPKAALRIANSAADRFGLSGERFEIVERRTKSRKTAATLEVLPAS